MSQLELYRIVDGPTVYTITSGDTAVTYNSELYTPRTLGRSESESKTQLSRANIETKFGMDDAIGRKYMTSIVDAVVTITVFQKEAETGTISVVFKGRLSSVKPAISTITLVWENFFTSLRRVGLRRRFQRNCPHVLYGRGCNLNKDDWDDAGTATVIAGTVVTVGAASARPNGYFRGGMLKAPDGTLRFIINHVGSSLTLVRMIASLPAALPAAVSIYPGCDRTRETCNSRFNNLPNNGSTPFIPLINPFGGSSFT
jgi:uncharacterized phage protein (TIGR02218 family)